MWGILLAVVAAARAPEPSDFDAWSLGDRVWTPDALSLESMGLDARFTRGFAFEVRLGVFDFDGQKRALELAGMLRPQ